MGHLLAYVCLPTQAAGRRPAHQTAPNWQHQDSQKAPNWQQADIISRFTKGQIAIQAAIWHVIRVLKILISIQSMLFRHD